MDKSSMFESVLISVEYEDGQRQEIKVDEISGGNWQANTLRLGTVGTGDNQWLSRAQPSWRSYSVSGAIQTELAIEIYTGRTRNKSDIKRITHRWQPATGESLESVVERAKIDILFPGDIDDELPKANVAIFATGFVPTTRGIEKKRLVRAFCTVCGTEENPGQSIRGVKGDILAICDPCSKELAE